MADLPYFIPAGYKAVVTIPQEEHFNNMNENGEQIVQEPDEMFTDDYIRKIVANSKGENNGN